MLNHITIMGRLTANPELRSTNTGLRVASFRIACDRDAGRDESRVTDFIDVVAWRATGEFVCRHFEKGMPILVNGRLQIREYVNRDGVRVRVPEIIAENLYFCGGEKTRRPEEAAPADLRDLGDDDLPWDEDLPL